MSSLNLTVDDFDPLVSYSDYDSWQTPNPQDHPDWYNQTEEVTNMPWHQGELRDVEPSQRCSTEEQR